MTAERKRLGMNQAKLAEALGLHWVTISNYERGQDPILKVVGLAVRALEYEARGTRKTA